VSAACCLCCADVALCDAGSTERGRPDLETARPVFANTSLWNSGAIGDWIETAHTALQRVRHPAHTAPAVFVVMLGCCTAS